MSTDAPSSHPPHKRQSSKGKQSRRRAKVGQRRERPAGKKTLRAERDILALWTSKPRPQYPGDAEMVRRSLGTDCPYSATTVHEMKKGLPKPVREWARWEPSATTALHVRDYIRRLYTSKPRAPYPGETAVAKACDCDGSTVQEAMKLLYKLELEWARWKRPAPKMLAAKRDILALYHAQPREPYPGDRAIANASHDSECLYSEGAVQQARKRLPARVRKWARWKRPALTTLTAKEHILALYRARPRGLYPGDGEVGGLCGCSETAVLKAIELLPRAVQRWVRKTRRKGPAPEKMLRAKEYIQGLHDAKTRRPYPGNAGVRRACDCSENTVQRAKKLLPRAARRWAGRVGRPRRVTADVARRLREMFKTGEPYPGDGACARGLGCSRGTVRKAKQALTWEARLWAAPRRPGLPPTLRQRAAERMAEMFEAREPYPGDSLMASKYRCSKGTLWGAKRLLPSPVRDWAADRRPAVRKYLLRRFRAGESCPLDTAVMRDCRCRLDVIAPVKRVLPADARRWAEANGAQGGGGPEAAALSPIPSLAEAVVPARPDLPAASADGAQGAQAKRAKLSKEALAIAALKDHPDWPDTEIAKAAGCSRTSLYRMPNFLKAREILKRGKADVPRGSKNADDGTLEAWDSEEA